MSPDKLRRERAGGKRRASADSNGRERAGGKRRASAGGKTSPKRRRAGSIRAAVNSLA